MPVYRYKCECGNEFDQFLKVDKSSVLLRCQGCGRGNSARQVRDKSAVIHENNEVRGIFHHDTKS